MFGQPLSYTKPDQRFVRRNVTCAKPCQAAIISKRPGDGLKSRKMFAERRKEEESTREKSENIKENRGLIIRHEFEQVTERKGLMNKLRQGVTAGLEGAGRDLQLRREKLRCMLLGEEQAWTKEYVEKEQRLNEKKLEEMKLKVEEIRNKREVERQKLVQEKRIQQYFERCEDLRSVKSQRFTKEAKRGQEYQMKEQEYIKEQEGEVERMWAEMTQKEYEAKVAREIEEARKKFERDKEVAEVLLLQRKSIEAQTLEERRRIKEEEAMMKEKIEVEIRKEKITALENKIKAREKMYNDLMEQIRRREDFLNNMAKEEEILEETLCQVAQDELEKELASRRDYREVQKRESNMYRDSVAQLRRQRAAEEAELEKILQQERNKIEAERKEKLARLEAARQKLKDEVLQGRKVQVEHQKEMAEKLKKEEEEEFKLQELVRLENARLTAEHDNQIRLLKRKYAKDLRDQIEYSKMLKAREREEIERDWKAGLLEEECYKRLIKELLSRREEIEPHPFWRIIDASASLDGPCRCPVPEAKEGGTQRR